MVYTKTIWKNREVERPRTFRFQNNSDGTVTLIPAEGAIIEAGTPIIAINMNNIENAIEELYDVKTIISPVAPKNPKEGQRWIEI